MTQLVLGTGAKNIPKVAKAKGKADILKNGILRPDFDLHRSDFEAIQGSVNASNNLPIAVIAPIIVMIPKTTLP